MRPQTRQNSKPRFWLQASCIVLLASTLGCSGDEEKKKWAVKKVDLTRKKTLARKIKKPAFLEKLSHVAEITKNELDEPYVFRWPMDELDITSPYGHRMHPVVKRVLFHRGVDLAAPRGTPVMSTGPGIVEFAGTLPLTGKTVIVAHTGGYQSLYAHLEEILVWEEMVVDIGAPVGLIGSTGRSTGPHLHFQINKEGKSVDPTDILGTRIVPEAKAPAGTSGDSESSLGMAGALP